MKNYVLWATNRNAQSGHEKIQTTQEACQQGFPVKVEPSKLDDLQTSLLLYHYGLPIEIVLETGCKLPNGLAVKCKTKSISSEIVDLLYTDPKSGNLDKNDVGLTLHVDVREVGPVKGVVAAQNMDGFQINVDEESRTSLGDRLANLTSSLGVRHDVTIAAGPEIQRLEPENSNCCFEDDKGRMRNGRIVNLSQIDALIRAKFIPRKSSIIFFKGPCRYLAEVTSVFAIGFMAQFATPIRNKDFSTQIKFTD
jgi:hypothetical protein